MSHVVSFVLSVAGSVLATLCLVGVSARRAAPEKPGRRIPAGLTLALLFLSCALVARVFELMAIKGTIAPLSWIDLGLLLAGAAATLWAFVGGRRGWGALPAGERIPRRGKVALALLLADLAVDMASGRVADAVQQLPGPAGGLAFLLGVPTLLLLAVGTGAAALTFRSASSWSAGPGSLLRRLSTPTKGMFVLLGLALAGVVLAAILAPASGLFVCLMLLTLGLAAGLLALFYKAKTAPGREPLLGGISPRGWVSLALLSAAGFVLGAQEVQYVSHWDTYLAGRSARTPVEKPALDQPVPEAPSLWSMRLLPRPEATPQEKELDAKRWKRLVQDARAKTDKDEGVPSPSQPTVQPPGAAPPPTKKPSADAAAQPDLVEVLARLAKTVTDLDGRMTALESVGKGTKPDNNPPVAPSIPSPGADTAHTARGSSAGEGQPPTNLGGLVERLEQLNRRMAALESAKGIKPAPAAPNPGHPEKASSTSGSGSP